MFSTKQTEVDLLWYMWKESNTDLRSVNNLKNTTGNMKIYACKKSNNKQKSILFINTK